MIEDLLPDDRLNKIFRNLYKLHEDLCEELSLREVLEKYTYEAITDTNIKSIKHDIKRRINYIEKRTRISLEERIEEELYVTL